MQPSFYFILLVAAVAATGTQEDSVRDQTSLLQVGNTLNANRGAIEGKAAKDGKLGDASAEVEEFIEKPSTVDAPTDPAAALVGKVFKLFGQGKLKDKGCEHAVKNLFTKDAVIDFRGPRDSQYFKKYDQGVHGVCEYFRNSYDLHLHDLKVNLYNKGDKLIDVWNYIPGLGGKDGQKATETMTQYNMCSFNENKTKLSSIEVLFDKPEILDRLKFGKKMEANKTSQLNIAARVLDAFTNKKFVGSSCQDHITELFAEDSEVDETPFFQKFAGLNGVCDYFQKCYMAKMHNLTSNMYARGDDVVIVLNYVPGLANMDVKASSPIIQYNVVHFHKDKKKVSGFHVFFDKPALFAELSQAALQQMMAGAQKAKTAMINPAHPTVAPTIQSNVLEGNDDKVEEEDHTQSSGHDANVDIVETSAEDENAEESKSSDKSKDASEGESENASEDDHAEDSKNSDKEEAQEKADENGGSPEEQDDNGEEETDEIHGASFDEEGSQADDKGEEQAQDSAATAQEEDDSQQEEGKAEKEDGDKETDEIHGASFDEDGSQADDKGEEQAEDSAAAAQEEDDSQQEEGKAEKEDGDKDCADCHPGR